MRVIVIGCGRLGAELAYRLYQRGHDVSVIDNLAAAFNILPPDFQGRTVEGDTLNQDVLYRAGIEHADGVAVVTNQDALNAVVGHIARVVYHVPHIIVRNYDPHERPIHEAFGLQIVSSTIWGAKRIEELLFHGGVRTICSAGNGEVEIYEMVITDLWNGRSLAELLPPGESLPISVTRAGRAILPEVNMCLQTGDIVQVSASTLGLEALRAKLKWEGES